MSAFDPGTAGAFLSDSLVQTVLGGLVLAAILTVAHRVWQYLKAWNQSRVLAHHLLRRVMVQVEQLSERVAALEREHDERV